jgi:ABC-2 type transport system permease protein
VSAPPTRVGNGTFTPQPGAATRVAMVASQARMEIRLLLRNGEQVVLSVVIPMLALVGGAVAASRLDIGGTRPIEVLTPGVLALAILSTSFTSLAIGTGFERRYGVLKQLGVTPLPRAGLLAGKILSLLTVQLGQLALICLVAAALGWRPVLTLATVATAVALWWSGSAAFGAWALLIAGTLRAEATLALANLVFVLLLAGGAVLAPATTYGPAAGLVRALPSGALAEGLRDALGHGRVDGVAVVVLLGWAIVGSVAASRTFRWE